MSPARALPTTHPAKRRWVRRAQVAAVLLLALVLVIGAALARLGFTPAEAWHAARSRQTMELVRYAEFRLLGHPKLESVLLPVLSALRQRLEREPQLPFVDLGKGQRATALPMQTFDEAGNPQPAPPLAGEAAATVPALRTVSRSGELRAALAEAQPGTVLELLPGEYTLTQSLRTGRAGEPRMPIVVRAAKPGSVLLKVDTVQGIIVDQPYWVFENLDWRGICADDSACEHAFHIVGAARGTVVRNNRIEDFNAQIKINGENGLWPDNGLLQFNTLINRGARQTSNPVTPVDLVAASGWQLLDNQIEHFVKARGNGLSYGLFMKGASDHGRIERNVVVCTRQGISQPGLRVGISLGGGGTGAAFCRDQRCEAEHSDGVIANNIVAHCNDVGIDINRSPRSLVAHNTLVNTLGILAREKAAEMDALNNLVEGGLHTRRDATLRHSGNKVEGRLDDLLQRPDALDLRWQEFPAPLPRNPLVQRDFCGQPRPMASPPGATVSPSCKAGPPAVAQLR